MKIMIVRQSGGQAVFIFVKVQTPT